MNRQELVKWLRLAEANRVTLGVTKRALCGKAADMLEADARQPPIPPDELTQMWMDAVRYANPTAADAHLRYARAIERKVRGE